jgi:hypothetical protein
MSKQTNHIILKFMALVVIVFLLGCATFWYILTH